jgi:hypothetical protein
MLAITTVAGVSVEKRKQNNDSKRVREREAERKITRRQRWN